MSWQIKYIVGSCLGLKIIALNLARGRLTSLKIFDQFKAN